MKKVNKEVRVDLDKGPLKGTFKDAPLDQRKPMTLAQLISALVADFRERESK